MTQTHYRKAAFDLPPLPEPGKLPEWVPVLTAGDMCVDEAHRGRRHCAVGWSTTLGIPLQPFIKAYKAANNTRLVSGHNDHICTTNAQRAAAFNKAMVELGYRPTDEETGGAS